LIGQYAHGNEPSHHIAYLYSYAGASWKTQAMAARILREMYHNKPDGISGNEDCGQMSAWYVLSSLGFYSVQPASGIYVLGSPKFEEAVIHLENGNSFTIKRKGSGDYINKARLNGKEYLNSFITFKTIQEGGKLELTMSEEPNKEFGKAKKYRPSSYIKPTLLPAPVINTVR
jgi:predicted alpha-1,2-mannosidase